jgi:hypothetical protein
MKLQKALQITHRSRVALLKRVDFSVTPKESVTLTFNTGIDAPVYSWEGGVSSNANSLSSATGPYRSDIKLIDYEGTVEGGFTFTHEARGKGLSYKDFQGNRALRTEIYSFINGTDGVWRCWSGGHVADSIILPQGVTSRRGRNGENIITIKSATPDAFLGRLTLPQMPYLLAGPANRERFAQAFLAENGYDPFKPAPSPLPDSTQRRAAIQNRLGYTLQGAGDGGIYDGLYVDPFSRFANFNYDDYTMTVGQVMPPAPANDLHIMSKLDSSRALVELCNHFKVNGRPIMEMLNMNILTAKSIEDDLLHFEVSGSFNSIVAEAAKHGCWTWRWNSKSQFFFEPDYCSMGIDEIPVAITLVDGPSLIGDIEVALGTPSIRISRVGVKPQPLLNFGDSTTDPITTNFDNMRLGRTYPVDTPPGGIGSEILFENYMGRNAQKQAKRLWAKSNIQTQANWNNHPYPELSMGMLGRVAAFKIKDPRGAFDFSNGDTSFPRPDLTYKTIAVYNPETESYEEAAGGKLFKCVRVKGTWQDNGRGGGAFMCSDNFEEIIAEPSV